jgi:4'-phosphopantetheinyl transferase
MRLITMSPGNLIWQSTSLRGEPSAPQAAIYSFDPRESPATEHWSWLSAAEQRRVEAIRNEKVKARFVRCRATVRQILARHLNITPPAVPIREEEHQKPYLDATGGHCFNLSHCDDLALLAVSSESELGVDVERLRDMPRALDIAGRYLGAAEARAIAAAGPATQSEAFLICWTRTEACVKALGLGLASHMDQFAVGATEMATMVEAPAAAGRRLRLFSFRPDSQHIAAVAFAR